MKSTTYEYSQPVTMSLHSVGTGFLAFMKSSDPSAPQHPTCKNVKFSDFTKKKSHHFQKASENTARFYPFSFPNLNSLEIPRKLSYLQPTPI